MLFVPSKQVLRISHWGSLSDGPLASEPLPRLGYTLLVTVTNV